MNPLIVNGEKHRYDCSGFVLAAYAGAGLPLRGSTRDMYEKAESWGLLHEGRTAKPGEKGKAPFHFLAYTEVGGAVYELDGLAADGAACLGTPAQAAAPDWLAVARDAIRAPSIALTLPGRGAAVYDGATTSFRYLDRWSELTTWAFNEPPVEGDSVVVPEGQAILVDISPPRLFLGYVAGALVFDRRDLAFNASYIVVHGGALEAGTEAEPFLHKLTITLHGDRRTAIEIPEVGAKMLTVMSRMDHSGGGGMAAMGTLGTGAQSDGAPQQASLRARSDRKAGAGT
jgi:hypothetical protein